MLELSRSERRAVEESFARSVIAALRAKVLDARGAARVAKRHTKVTTTRADSTKFVR